MKWKIKDIEIPNQFCLAPMAGIGNLAFRQLCKEYDCGLITCEMVSDKAIDYRNEKTLKMTYVSEKEHPISMQIFGATKESLVKAAVFLDTKTNCDIIDINMGCPVNKVAKKSQAGASLLKEPEKIYDIVSSVVNACKKPITVKIRIGWDFDSINAVYVAKEIERAGASAIAIHGRTRSQFYSGDVNYDVIKDVVNAVKIPVIGNGNITDIESCKKMFETGCKAVMIGRGALGNPFIFRKLVNYFENKKDDFVVTNDLIFKTIKKHYELLRDLKGDRLALVEMRSHIAWYIKGLNNNKNLKDKINTLNTYDDVIKELEDYFKNYA